MEEWKSYKLGEIATIQTGPFGSQLHQSDYVDDGVPCIMPTNIGRMLDFQVDEIAHITTDNALKLSRHIVHEGDIVYSRRGDIEKCAYVSQEQAGWFCGTGCLKISINPILAIPKYVAYLLSTAEIRNWIVGNAVGTTMLNLNTSVLADVPLSLPSFQIQRRCVQILDSIESKISLNNRINHNLEEQAQALYKSWFVDFEPFKNGGFADSELGLIPEGWRVLPFSEFVQISNEKVDNEHIPEFSVTNSGIIPRDTKFNKQLSSSSLKNKIIRKGDLVFGMSREILNWGVMNDVVGGVSPAYTVYKTDKRIMDEDFLRLYIQHHPEYFKDLIKPAAREGQGIDKKVLASKKIYMPEDTIWIGFKEMINSLVVAQHVLMSQVDLLTNLRDEMLPTLMGQSSLFRQMNC